ncbi:hypothetical protein HQ865_04905 [Mucilaginibacter mali]|uniref:TonB-dependent receptor plug domain-containing protein n=1 Tax=Mucilaginibacter mali TaxID=2740462 RepID=A0A7D4UNM6_9SPHI|nr:hypothetical protein [Mucilaginibacter mali]QKJ29120.1 hypothetical protein HQ865_04905 [Mucilaginibacter mali]
MKKLFVLLLSMTPLFLFAQSGSKAATAQTPSKDQLCVVDNKVITRQELDKVNPENVVDIQVLNSAAAKALYGDSGVNGAIIVVTKKFAISSYQEKFSDFSADYESYLTSHGTDDKQFIYIINNMALPKDKNEVRKLYDIPKDKIESVVFIQDQPEGSKILAKVAITTKK